MDIPDDDQRWGAAGIKLNVGSSSYNTGHAGVLCAVCPKRASKSCLTCMVSYCEIHVRPHYTAPALQRHRLVEATEDLEQKMCPRHHRELELYCRTDQTAICVLCVAVEHIGHDITELGEHQEMHMFKSELKKKTETNRQLQDRVRQLEEVNKELGEKNKQLEERNKQLEERNKQLEDKNKQLEDKNKQPEQERGDLPGSHHPRIRRNSINEPPDMQGESPPPGDSSGAV